MENKYTVIRTIEMNCPICGKTHTVEERIRDAVNLYRGKTIKYKETYYFCSNADEEENEFENGGMLDANLLNARKAYESLEDYLDYH